LGAVLFPSSYAVEKKGWEFHHLVVIGWARMQIQMDKLMKETDYITSRENYLQ